MRGTLREIIKNVIFGDSVLPVIFVEPNNSEKNPEGERHPTQYLGRVLLDPTRIFSDPTQNQGTYTYQGHKSTYVRTYVPSLVGTLAEFRVPRSVLAWPRAP